MGTQSRNAKPLQIEMKDPRQLDDRACAAVASVLLDLAELDAEQIRGDEGPGPTK